MWLIIYFTKLTECSITSSMFEWFQTQFLIDSFSWDIRYYSASYCLTSIILDRFYFLMEWCIECFLVKNISVAEIGVIKGFIKGNQSLLLCNHALTHFLQISLFLFHIIQILTHLKRKGIGETFFVW